jgi:MSHA pilin protein MshA
MKNQNGFTLIELVIVIVLLGVLAAIAVPRFVNLEDDAQEAALNASAAAITSAMNINYAGCAVNNHDAVANPNDCKAVETCGDADEVLNGGLGVFEVSNATATVGLNNGDTLACTLRRQGTTSPTRPFTAVRAGT